MSNNMSAESVCITPLAEVEACYETLLQHYGEAEDAGLRAAAKLLLVALVRLHQHDEDWECLALEYIKILKFEPERYARLLAVNRGQVPGD